MKTPLVIATLLLLIATATMPYGYYQFLRIAITIAAGITAYNLFEKKQNNWLIAFVLIMILYNPIIVIHLDKAIWKPINIVTALFFCLFVLANKYKETK
jgi:intracellular septation protein A